MIKETHYKDFKIHYREEGRGEPLILLHGFCESSDIWDEFTKVLSQRFRVITPDLLGHGKSVKLVVPVNPPFPPFYKGGDGGISEKGGFAWEYVHTMEMQAECVAEVLKAAGVEKCTIAGHSMGGYTALAFAELFPQKVRGLCLFHSTAMADTEEKKLERDRAIEAVKRDKIAFLEGLIPKMFAPPNVERMKDKVARVMSIAKNIHENDLIAAIAGMRNRKDRQHVLENADYSVLFIIGKNDLLIPCDTMLTQIIKPRHSEVLMLSGVGHMGFYEATETTLFAIEKFMEETAFSDEPS